MPQPIRDKHRKARVCPYCQSTKVVPILYGYPSPYSSADAEGVVLGGCLVLPEKWHCSNCEHRWMVMESASIPFRCKIRVNA